MGASAIGHCQFRIRECGDGTAISGCQEQRGPSDAADGAIDVTDSVKEKKRKEVVRS
jgi:hypothetical protein